MSFEELLNLLAEQFSCDPSDLSKTTELAELGADHEDFIELAWNVGEALGIEVNENTLEQCETIGDLFRMIRDLEEDA